MINELQERIESLGFATKLSGNRILAGEEIVGEGFTQFFSGSNFYVDRRGEQWVVRLLCAYPTPTPLESFFETDEQVIGFLQPIAPANNSEAA
jgi:hypothetical protein